MQYAFKIVDKYYDDTNRCIEEREKVCGTGPGFERFVGWATAPVLNPNTGQTRKMEFQFMIRAKNVAQAYEMFHDEMNAGAAELQRELSKKKVIGPGNGGGRL